MACAEQRHFRGPVFENIARLTLQNFADLLEPNSVEEYAADLALTDQRQASGKEMGDSPHGRQVEKVISYSVPDKQRRMPGATNVER